VKILHIHNYYLQSGGEDQVFRSETDLLESYGHEVIRYTRHNQEIEHQSKIATGINTIWNNHVFHELDRKLSIMKPDVCHVHNTFPIISPSVYYACKKNHVPIVQRLPNYRLICPGALLLRNSQICMDCIEKRFPWPGVRHACYRDSRTQSAVVFAMLSFHRVLHTWQNKVDFYVALNNYGKELFIRGGLPEDKIMVSPNMVEPDPGETKQLGSYALYVGRLSKEKGLDTLLDSWKNLPDVPLKIIGDGPLYKEIEQKIAEEQISNVELLGHKTHEEAVSILKCARVLIFPSEWLETFGLGIIEAFACGVTVIASRQKTIREIIDDGVNGLLFEPGNAFDLAEKVKGVWGQPTTLKAFSFSARQSYETRYSKDQKIQSLMGIYGRAIENNKRSNTGRKNTWHAC